MSNFNNPSYQIPTTTIGINDEDDSMIQDSPVRANTPTANAPFGANRNDNKNNDGDGDTNMTESTIEQNCEMDIDIGDVDVNVEVDDFFKSIGYDRSLFTGTGNAGGGNLNFNTDCNPSNDNDIDYGNIAGGQGNFLDNMMMTTPTTTTNVNEQQQQEFSFQQQQQQQQQQQNALTQSVWPGLDSLEANFAQPYPGYIQTNVASAPATGSADHQHHPGQGPAAYFYYDNNKNDDNNETNYYHFPNDYDFGNNYYYDDDNKFGEFSNFGYQAENYNIDYNSIDISNIDPQLLNDDDGNNNSIYSPVLFSNPLSNTNDNDNGNDDNSSLFGNPFNDSFNASFKEFAATGATGTGYDNSQGTIATTAAAAAAAAAAAVPPSSNFPVIRRSLFPLPPPPPIKQNPPPPPPKSSAKRPPSPLPSSPSTSVPYISVSAPTVGNSDSDVKERERKEKEKEKEKAKRIIIKPSGILARSSTSLNTNTNASSTALFGPKPSKPSKPLASGIFQAPLFSTSSALPPGLALPGPPTPPSTTLSSLTFPPAPPSSSSFSSSSVPKPSSSSAFTFTFSHPSSSSSTSKEKKEKNTVRFPSAPEFPEPAPAPTPAWAAAAFGVSPSPAPSPDPFARLSSSPTHSSPPPKIETTTFPSPATTAKTICATPLVSSSAPATAPKDTNTAATTTATAKAKAKAVGKSTKEITPPIPTNCPSPEIFTPPSLVSNNTNNNPIPTSTGDATNTSTNAEAQSSIYYAERPIAIPRTRAKAKTKANPFDTSTSIQPQRGQYYHHLHHHQQQQQQQQKQKEPKQQEQPLRPISPNFPTFSFSSPFSFSVPAAQSIVDTSAFIQLEEYRKGIERGEYELQWYYGSKPPSPTSTDNRGPGPVPVHVPVPAPAPGQSAEAQITVLQKEREELGESLVADLKLLDELLKREETERQEKKDKEEKQKQEREARPENERKDSNSEDDAEGVDNDEEEEEEEGNSQADRDDLDLLVEQLKRDCAEVLDGSDSEDHDGNKDGDEDEVESVIAYSDDGGRGAGNGDHFDFSLFGGEKGKGIISQEESLNETANFLLSDSLQALYRKGREEQKEKERIERAIIEEAKLIDTEMIDDTDTEKKKKKEEKEKEIDMTRGESGGEEEEAASREVAGDDMDVDQPNQVDPMEQVEQTGQAKVADIRPQVDQTHSQPQTESEMLVDQQPMIAGQAEQAIFGAQVDQTHPPQPQTESEMLVDQPMISSPVEPRPEETQRPEQVDIRAQVDQTHPPRPQTDSQELFDQPMISVPIDTQPEKTQQTEQADTEDMEEVQQQTPAQIHPLPLEQMMNEPLVLQPTEPARNVDISKPVHDTTFLVDSAVPTEHAEHTTGPIVDSATPAEYTEHAEPNISSENIKPAQPENPDDDDDDDGQSDDILDDLFETYSEMGDQTEPGSLAEKEDTDKDKKHVDDNDDSTDADNDTKSKENTTMTSEENYYRDQGPLDTTVGEAGTMKAENDKSSDSNIVLDDNEKNNNSDDNSPEAHTDYADKKIQQEQEDAEKDDKKLTIDTNQSSTANTTQNSTIASNPENFISSTSTSTDSSMDINTSATTTAAASATQGTKSSPTRSFEAKTEDTSDNITDAAAEIIGGLNTELEQTMSENRKLREQVQSLKEINQSKTAEQAAEKKIHEENLRYQTINQVEMQKDNEYQKKIITMREKLLINQGEELKKHAEEKQNKENQIMKLQHELYVLNNRNNATNSMLEEVKADQRSAKRREDRVMKESNERQEALMMTKEKLDESQEKAASFLEKEVQADGEAMRKSLFTMEESFADSLEHDHRIINAVKNSETQCVYQEIVEEIKKAVQPESHISSLSPATKSKGLEVLVQEPKPSGRYSDGSTQSDKSMKPETEALLNLTPPGQKRDAINEDGIAAMLPSSPLDSENFTSRRRKMRELKRQRSSSSSSSASPPAKTAPITKDNVPLMTAADETRRSRKSTIPGMITRLAGLALSRRLSAQFKASEGEDSVEEVLARNNIVDDDIEDSFEKENRKEGKKDTLDKRSREDGDAKSTPDEKVEKVERTERHQKIRFDSSRREFEAKQERKQKEEQKRLRQAKVNEISNASGVKSVGQDEGEDNRQAQPKYTDLGTQTGRTEPAEYAKRTNISTGTMVTPEMLPPTKTAITSSSNSNSSSLPPSPSNKKSLFLHYFFNALPLILTLVLLLAFLHDFLDLRSERNIWLAADEGARRRVVSLRGMSDRTSATSMGLDFGSGSGSVYANELDSRGDIGVSSGSGGAVYATSSLLDMMRWLERWSRLGELGGRFF